MKNLAFGFLALALPLAFPLPLSGQIAVVSGLVQEQAARPGETYKTTIRLRNGSTEPQEAKVYLTDYEFFANGANHYNSPGGLARSNARWVSFTPSSVIIPAHAEVPVEVTVRVPAAAAMPLAGTYWSALMVEGIPKGSAESSRAEPKARVTVGLETTMRYAVQFATHIQDTGLRKMDFAGTKVIATPLGAKTLQFDVQNSGERAYRPLLRTELYNEQGTLVGKFENQRGLLYPGSSLRQQHDLGTVPPGTYKALVIADTGGDEVFGAQYTLKL